MKKISLWLLLTAGVAVTAAQTGQQDSETEKATRAMCDDAAPKLREFGANKVVLMMTVDSRDEWSHSRLSKGLRLEKMKEVATAIKAMPFHPAEKDGSPAAVQARIAFDCPAQPPSASNNQ
jgi:hypothetical protein